MKKHIISLLFFVFIFTLSYHVIEDIDFGWHVRAGEYIAQSKSVPKHDLFTFSQPDYPYIYHSWLSELLLFESYSIFRLAGASSLYALVLTITMYTLYKTSKIISSNKVNYILFTLATLITYTVAGGRTRIFSLLCLSLVYYCFVKFYFLNSKFIWGIPCIMILWANLHGSFPFGLGFLVIVSLAHLWFGNKSSDNKQKLIKLARVTLISTLATLINPYFQKAWVNTLKVFINSATKISNINPDWKSLGAENSSSWILIAITGGIIILAYLLMKEKAKIHLFLATLFLVLSFLTSRFLIGLVVIAIPLANLTLVEIGKRLPKSITSSIPVRFSIASTTAVLLLAAFLNILQAKTAYNSEARYAQFLAEKSQGGNYPTWSLKANNYLDANIKNAFTLNEGNWGGLMLLKNPSRKIFYYSAMDNYIIEGRPFAFEYLSIVNAQSGWEKKIKNYKINTIYLPPEYPLVKKLENDNNWKVVYKDNQAVIITQQ